MFGSLKPAPDQQRSHRFAMFTVLDAAGHWRLVAVLLSLEYLLVSLLFDAQPLRQQTGLAYLLGYTDMLIPLALAAGTAAVLVGGKALWRDLRWLVTAESARSSSPRWLAVHVVAFAVFLILTAALFGAIGELGDGSAIATGAWFISGIVSAMSLLRSVVSFRTLSGVLLRNRPAIGAALLAGLLASVAAAASEALWLPLSQVTLVIVAALLRMVSANVISETFPPTIGMDEFRVTISPDCSGYEGVGLILVFLSLYLWSARDRLRFPAVLALVPLAVAIVWFANSLRIAALVAIGAWWSPDVALGGFHSKAGWILFCTIALGVVAIAQRTAIFSKQEKQHDTWNPTAAHLVPVLTLIAVSMITGLFVTGFDVLYSVPIVASLAALAAYRGYFRPSWCWSSVGSGGSIAIGVLVFVAWTILEPAPDAVAVATWHESFAALPPWIRTLWLTSRVLGSVIVVPVVEELAFRGYVMRRLLSRNFDEVSLTGFPLMPLAISSLIFGLVHEHFFGAVLAGVGYGVAYALRGRIGDAILAHVATNGLIAVYVLWAGQWSLWM